MANEIQLRYPETGRTIKYTIRNAAGQYWNGSAFEAFNISNWATYGVALPETPSGGYLYLANFPTAIITAGFYFVDLFLQAGATFVIADTQLRDGVLQWDGEKEVTPVDIDSLIDAIKAKTDTIGSANMTVTSPVTEDGDIEIVAGDGYETDGGNGPLTFTVTDYAGPDLTGAAAELLLLAKATYDADATSLGTATGTVAIAAGGTTITYTVTLTAAQTAALAPAPPADKYNYVYQLKITPVAGEVFTPALGTLNVIRKVG